MLVAASFTVDSRYQAIPKVSHEPGPFFRSFFGDVAGKLLRMQHCVNDASTQAAIFAPTCTSVGRAFSTLTSSKP